MDSTAFLFDIDGVLTLPITEQLKISVIDPYLIELLSKIHQQGIKFSFITGRAYPWVKKFLLSDYSSFLTNIPIFMEYGLTSVIDNKLNISDFAGSFRKQFFRSILSAIQVTCDKKNIFFNQSPYVDYPSHKSLWLEEKNVMISIASNTNITPEQVQRIVIESVQDFSNEIRIVKHHLGCDILPKGWSKERAAVESYLLLDPDKKIHQWYVFGDNESDKEMCKPFSNVLFVDTKIGASETTKQFLQNIL